MEQCEHCGKSFAKKYGHLYRHIREVHHVNIYKRAPKVDNQATIKCGHCEKTFTNRNSLYNHRSQKHRDVLKVKSPNRQKIDSSSEAETKILETFPNRDSTKYTINRCGKKKSGINFVEVKFPICNILEMTEFRQEYEELNAVCLRTSASQWKSKKSSVMYQKKFHCWHFIKPSKHAHGERHTDCPFRFHVKVLDENSVLNAYIRLIGAHNHNLKCASSVKFRDVSDLVKEKFLSLFSYGFTPSRALKRHMKDLEDEFEENFFKVVGDRSLSPGLKWVQRLHNSIFQKEFGKQYGLQMLHLLSEKVAEFQHARIELMGDNYVIGIVTPFMKRVQNGFRESNEMIFIDSTGTIDLLNCKVFTMMTNSCAGGMPVAVIITTTESRDAIALGLKMVKDLSDSFNPQIFMSDNSAAERGALSDIFPQSTLLLCQFHVLQCVWRFVWRQESQISATDRHPVFFEFKALVHEVSKQKYMEKRGKFLGTETAAKYPQLTEYLQQYWRTEEAWASCFRRELITRGQTTNNICESSMRIIKDVILERTKAYSPVHLFQIFTTEFEKYYTTKLISICNGRIPDYLKMSKRKMEKLKGLQYDVISQKVHNENSNTSYDINIDLCTCSCPAGIGGAICKHLYFVLQLGTGGQVMMLPVDQNSRIELFKVATGKQPSESDCDWFAPLIGTSSNDTIFSSGSYRLNENCADKNCFMCVFDLILNNKVTILCESNIHQYL